MKNLSVTEKFSLFKRFHTAAKKIQEWIKKWKIDLVYTNTSVTPIGRMAARRDNIPHIWHIREFGDLDFSLVPVFSKKNTKKFIRSSEAIICHAKVIQDYHFPNKPTNVFQVYNGVANREEFQRRLQDRPFHSPDDHFVFAMLSKISPKKRQETAIRAVGSLKEKGIHARLLLAGDGKPEYVERLRQLAAKLDLTDRVDFLGFVADPFEVYGRADGVLICSEHEAFSRVGLEAMSTALPLIGRNSGGTPEIIVDGETGLLYDTFDELVEGMTRMVQNPDWARQLGLAGWQRAREKFNIEDYAANVYNVIQSVMK